MEIISFRLAVFLVCCGRVAAENIVELGSAIQKRYNLKCTAVLHKESKTPHDRAVRIAKEMMLTGSFVIVKSINEYVRLFEEKQIGEKGCMRFILADEEEDIRKDIEKLAMETPVKKTVWLVSLTPNTTIGEYFRDVNAAFDMDFLVAQGNDSGIGLRDVYRVSMKHDIRIIDYGEWSLLGGLKLTTSPWFYERHQDLEGVVLKVAAKEKFSRKNGTRIRGVLGRIWVDLERKFNFSSKYKLTKETGTLLGKNRWSGIMGLLSHGQDAGVSDIIMSPERCEAVSCLKPIIYTRNQLYFKKTGIKIQLDAILKPFHTTTWLAISCWYLVLSFSLGLFFRIGKRFSIESGAIEFNAMNSLTTTFNALCQQGSHVTPQSISCRLVFFMAYMISSILFTAYSASLISFIALQSPARPFESLEELSLDPTRSLQMLKDSSTYSSFATSTNQFVKAVFRDKVPKPALLPSTLDEALERVCQNEKIVYFGSEFSSARAVTNFNRRGKCEIISLEKPWNDVYITFVLSKETGFKEIFNSYLDVFKYSGFLERINRKPLHESKDNLEITFTGVGLAQVLQMYLILFAGIFFSLILFAAEKAVHLMNQRGNENVGKVKI